MSENYTAQAIAALSSGVYREQIFVKIAFPGYTARISDMPRDMTVNGELYIGSGALGKISVVAEATDISADPINLTLSGLDTNLVIELKDYAHQGAPVTITVVLFDAAELPIPDPVVIFTGVVDTMSLTVGKTLTIELVADHFLRMMFRGPDGRRRMQADQESIFLGTTDLGLQFSARLSEDVPWGVASARNAVGDAGGGGGGGGAQRGGTLQQKILRQ